MKKIWTNQGFIAEQADSKKVENVLDETLAGMLKVIKLFRDKNDHLDMDDYEVLNAVFVKHSFRRMNFLGETKSSEKSI